jgi:hypothetical protein
MHQSISHFLKKIPNDFMEKKTKFVISKKTVTLLSLLTFEPATLLGEKVGSLSVCNTAD